MALIFQLERLYNTFEVTAGLSNAFLVAMMPHVSDAAKKLELPVPHPVTVQQIVRSGVTPFLNAEGDWGGFGIELQGGWSLGFDSGHLNTFTSTNAYYGLQDPGEIPRFVGPVRMTPTEAVQLARDTLTKLGIPLEKVFAEQEPQITPPPVTRTGVVPRYRIQWLNPRGGGAVDMEINAEAKCVERLFISHNPNLKHPWPKIGITPVFQGKRIKTNPEYAAKLLPIVLKAVDDYGETLALKIPRPLNTNHVARFFVGNNQGWPHVELDLISGWRFIYRNSAVNGFYAPDNLFNSDQRPILIKDFVGEWKMTESEAITLVRQSIAKLKHPEDLVEMDFAPTTIKSVITNIPRYSLSWSYSDKEQGRVISKLEAEVDAQKKELKSLYFDHKSLWNRPPPIDVPIALPTTNILPQESQPSRSDPVKVTKPPTRPFIPFDSKEKR